MNQLIKNKHRLIFILTVIMIISQSCNLHIEKRRYRKGYYVEVNNKTKTGELKNKKIADNKMGTIKNNPVPLVTQHEAKIDSLKQVPILNLKKKSTVQKKTGFKNKSIPKIPFHKKSGDDDCDVIHLMDGTEIEAVVVNISETEITYKKCNFTDGPSYKISSGKVKSIDLHNGEEYIPSKENKEKNNSEITPGMIGGIITAGIALICVVIACILMFGGGYYGLIAAIPLAVAGTASLVGTLISIKYLKKGSHPLGKAAFYSNLALQIIAIILTVLMFIFFF